MIYHTKNDEVYFANKSFTLTRLNSWWNMGFYIFSFMIKSSFLRSCWCCQADWELRDMMNLFRWYREKFRSGDSQSLQKYSQSACCQQKSGDTWTSAHVIVQKTKIIHQCDKILQRNIYRLQGIFQWHFSGIIRLLQCVDQAWIKIL